MTEQTPSTESISRDILAYVRAELLGPDTDVGPEDDLLSGEWLDSMAVLQLATWVDTTFAIGMKPTDFRVENFQTVAALTRYVQGSLESRGG